MPGRITFRLGFSFRAFWGQPGNDLPGAWARCGGSENRERGAARVQGVGHLTGLVFASGLVWLAYQRKVFRAVLALTASPIRIGSPSRLAQSGHGQIEASTAFYNHRGSSRASPEGADAEYALASHIRGKQHGRGSQIGGLVRLGSVALVWAASPTPAGIDRQC
jgi:hypothetical protein